MLTAIPSKGRCNKVKTLEILPSAVVYCPMNEVKDYQNCNPYAKIVGVPNEVQGITKTRNWILDNANDRWVVMVDDDVKRQGYLRAYRVKMKYVKLNEQGWELENLKLFETTEQLGLRIWGVSTEGSPRSVYPYYPFRFRTYITASYMGIINDGRTRFDESFAVKEDYELCLRCIKEDGAILGARYLFWENSHWLDPGGCKDYRTQEMELNAIKRLIKMYPGLIRRVNRKSSGFCVELEF